MSETGGVFEVSAEMFEQITQEILMIGQQHKLEPHELVMVLKIAADALGEQLGLTVTKTQVRGANS